MPDTAKRWFEVTAAYEFALKVLARDRDEAVERFWERDEDITNSMVLADLFLEITSVDECEPNTQGEQVAS
jgi:hypothetical protein